LSEKGFHRAIASLLKDSPPRIRNDTNSAMLRASIATAALTNSQLSLHLGVESFGGVF
jgi:hypothetical protein